jgi:hypothetical protein
MRLLRESFETRARQREERVAIIWTMADEATEGVAAGELTRRQFGRVAAKAGLAASAAVWVAPQIASVALAHGVAGSPPPSTTTTTPTTGPPPAATTPPQKVLPTPKRAPPAKNAPRKPAAPPAATPVVAPPSFTE